MGGSGQYIAWPDIQRMWFAYRNPVSGRVPKYYWPGCVPCQFKPEWNLTSHGYQEPPTGPAIVEGSSDSFQIVFCSCHGGLKVRINTEGEAYITSTIRERVSLGRFVMSSTILCAISMLICECKMPHIPCHLGAESCQAVRRPTIE